MLKLIPLPMKNGTIYNFALLDGQARLGSL
jgi:hypothetical protein